MIRFFRNGLTSLRRFFLSEEIPLWDRLIVIAILVSVFSPIDLIPDTIPVIGLVDDLFWISVLYDYCFHVLPRDLALHHYEGTASGFQRWQNIFRFLGWLRPAQATRRIWRVSKAQVHIESSDSDHPSSD